MLKAARVVRGPDWKWGDQDGGNGCVGTVVLPQETGDNPTGVWVRWDSGKAANYRAGGASGKFDLRIYDNAQLGVKHRTVTCDACKQQGIFGIRWKCIECHDYDLCHTCYNEGKHDLKHRFSRIDASHVAGVEVPRRFGAMQSRAWGIFRGTRVMRGPDWEWDNQDGGEGTVGTVSDVGGGEGTIRSWVTVQWPNGSHNNYRRGHQGKLDVRYSERETEGQFYIEHLPNLDASQVRAYVSQGDKVRLLKMDVSKLKQLQLERCGWNEEIAQCMGKVGEVTMIDRDGDIKVKFGSSTYFIHPLCLTTETRANVTEASGGEQEHDLSDLLAALLLKSQLGVLAGLGHVGGSLGSPGVKLYNAAVDGDTNKVQEILRNNKEAAKFQNDQGQTPLHVASHGGHMNTVAALTRAGAPLEQKDNDGDTALAFAVLGNEPDIVKFLLLAGSNVNTADNQKLTPLHLAAAKGHQTCAEALLKFEQRKCDVNLKDKNGNSPLFVAIAEKKESIIEMLVDHPQVNLKLQNNNGFNSLHHAVLGQSVFAVQRILRRAGSNMINIAKPDGFTALHLAAFNGLPQILTTLIKQVNCNKELKTTERQTALHLAVDKTHNECIEALVNNGANVNAQDEDGDTSLHLVMMKASMKDIMGCTPLGKLLEIVQQVESGGDTSDEKSNLVAIAAYLIKNGANIYIKNNKGQDVLDVTLNPGIEKLLRDLYQAKARRAGAAKNQPCKVS